MCCCGLDVYTNPCVPLQENVALWQQLQSSEKEKQLILQQNEAEKNRGEEDIKRGQQQLQETREQVSQSDLSCNEHD